MFANTHWGFFLCTLYMLRTQCFCLSVLDAVVWIHLFCFLFYFLSHNFLTWTLWWWLKSFTSVHCSHIPVVSRWNTHPAVARFLIAAFTLPLFCVFTLHLTMNWSAVTLCIMVLHSLWTVSLRLRPIGFSDTLFNALFKVRLYRSYERYPKAKIQIFNFWQMQIPKKSLSCPSVLSLLPCSMCIKRQTQHWL